MITQQTKKISASSKPKYERRQGGFTLLEMLVVVVIIAVLGAAAVLGIGEMRRRSTVVSCGADRHTIEMAAHARAATDPGSAYGTLAILVAEGYLKDNTTLLSAFEDPDPATGAVEVEPGGLYGPVKVECEAL